jgi:ABC-2 type transport system permease protein
MQSQRWILHLGSVEIRRILSYRVDFWLQFIGGALTQIGTAYFLWNAIFTFNNTQSMRGYTFSALMLYYLMVPLVDRMIRGSEMGFIALEIFEGTLSRYLIYPVHVFTYKYVKQLSQCLVFSFNLVFSLLIFFLIFGVPSGVNISLFSAAKGLGAILLATYLFFILSSILEMIAFWVEMIWSLLVMLRMIILLLGGGMIPLAFFPEIIQRVIKFTPFPYLVSFPINTLWGKISTVEWLDGVWTILLWSAILSVIAYIVWKKGIREYTGVGI